MKRGFTLIELLAVIVILAIIALIAVPIVINIINDSKKESLQRSIDLYMDAASKAITKYQMKDPGFNSETCKIQSKGNLKCKDVEIEVEVKGKVPESGTIAIIDNKIYYDIVLEGMEYVLDKEGKKDPIAYVAPIFASEDIDYRGYYADVDGDGTVDGVIYADLAHENSETTWGRFYTDSAKYSYTKETNLKEYTISKTTYKANDGFGTKPIISVKKLSIGNPRFYVMALENFATTEYTNFYWYYNANMNQLITSKDFGEGKENTRQMILKWNASEYGIQNNQDIWKHIDEKYNEGWYIPSLGEWTAFADYFSNITGTPLTHDCTTTDCYNGYGNYNRLYGLSGNYWTSTQGTGSTAWHMTFYYGTMASDRVKYSFYVRLGATF